MSKRTIIIAVLAVLLFVAALFSVVFDFKKPEAEPEAEPEADLNRFKKGFRYDRVAKIWVPVEPKTEPEKPEAENV